MACVRRGTVCKIKIKIERWEERERRWGEIGFHVGSVMVSSSELRGSGSSSNVGGLLRKNWVLGALKASVALRKVARASIPSSVPRIVGRQMSLDIWIRAFRWPLRDWCILGGCVRGSGQVRHMCRRVRPSTKVTCVSVSGATLYKI